jgi:hypothetical protein
MPKKIITSGTIAATEAAAPAAHPTHRGSSRRTPSQAIRERGLGRAAAGNAVGRAALAGPGEVIASTPCVGRASSAGLVAAFTSQDVSTGPWGRKGRHARLKRSWFTSDAK